MAGIGGVDSSADLIDIDFATYSGFQLLLKLENIDCGAGEILGEFLRHGRFGFECETGISNGGYYMELCRFSQPLAPQHRRTAKSIKPTREEGNDGHHQGHEEHEELNSTVVLVSLRALRVLRGSNWRPEAEEIVALQFSWLPNTRPVCGRK